MLKKETVVSSPQEKHGFQPLSKRRALRRLWRAEVFYVCGLAGFVILAAFAHLYAFFAWDITIQQLIRKISLPGFDVFMRIVSMPGDGRTPYIISVLTALFFLLIRLRSEAAGIFLATTGSGIINGGIKMLIARPRPAFEPGMAFMSFTGNSFPSGHVTFYVCYFGFLFFVVYTLLPRGSFVLRLATFIFVLPILLVGLSRVYLFAHHPSDTIGAYLLGGLCLAITVELYRRWKQKISGFPLADDK